MTHFSPKTQLKHILQEKSRLEKEISAAVQRINETDIWLNTTSADTDGYQEKVEELLGLQTYIDELSDQLTFLTQTALDLNRQLESHAHPKSRLPF